MNARRLAMSVLALAPMTLLTSCKSNSISAVTNEGSSVVITATGGEFAGPDGLLIDVPANAVSANVTATLTTVTSYQPIPSGSVLVSPVFSLSPHGQTFNEPITVTLPYTPSGSASVSILHAGTTDPATAPWSVLSASPGPSETVNGVNYDTVSVLTSSFSYYAVVTGAATMTDSGAAFDSGAPLGSDAGMTFDGAPTDGSSHDSGGTCVVPSSQSPACLASIQCTGLGTSSCSCTFQPEVCSGCNITFECEPDAGNGPFCAEGSNGQGQAGSCGSICSTMSSAQAQAQNSCKMFMNGP
jgi:hypothetical protein